MKPHEFINSVKNDALASQIRTGIPASVIIAQACLETGYGNSMCVDINNGKQSNNLFNIKGNGPNGYVWCWTHEYYNGVRRKVKAKFRAYHNFEESFIDHSQFLFKSRYKPCIAVKDNPIQFAQKLQECGYATDPRYAQKLITIINQFGLTKLKPTKREDVILTPQQQELVRAMAVTIGKLVQNLPVEEQINYLELKFEEYKKNGGK